MNDSWFRKRRPWHRTLPQSLDNPLQADRLPDSSHVELEYPVVQHTPSENRRYTLWVFFLAVFLGGIAFAGQMITHTRAAAPYFQVFFLSAALLVYFTQIPFLRLRHRLVLCLLLWPISLAVLLAFPDRYVIIAIGMFATAILADRFASHFFYLKTAMPMPKSEAIRFRQLWARRFTPNFSTARGIELYWLTVLIVPAVFLFFLWSRQYFPDRHLLPLIPTVFPGLLLLLVLPLLIEALASFLTARRRLPLSLLCRSFASALVHWFTYNREDSQAAAVFRSPAGTQRQRRLMSLAAVGMLAAGISQFLFVSPDFSTLTNPEDQTPPQRNELFVPELPSSFDVSALPRPASTHALSLAAIAPQPRLLLAAAPALPDELQLEPWQEGLLRRASEEEREKYLERWRAQAQNDQDEEAKRAKAPAKTALSEQNPMAIISGFAAFFAFYILLAAFLPLIWFLATCFATSASVVAFYAHHFSITAPDDLLNPENWAAVVNRLRTSQDNIEKDSLFLGVNANDGSPVIVPRAVFQEHAHLLGDSGAGKTSIGLAGFISQLIRFGDASLVVIDLKADDLALFRNARVEARYLQMRLKKENPQATYRFRWFTPEIDHSTYVFNPLTQDHFRTLSVYQRADVLTAAFGLHYGTEYGRSHYSDANTHLLFTALQQCPNPSSFLQLARVFNNKEHFPSRLLQDGSHLIRIVERLASCEPLNVTPANKNHAGALRHAIDFADLFHTPQAVFFHLPSAIGAVGAAEIARLALYSLLSAAKQAGPKRKQVYLLIDEFQIMAASNLEFILQTARSMNIGVILANQSLNSLASHGDTLISTVRACTRFRQVFAASDYTDQQELIGSSGESLVHSRAWSQYLGAVAGLSGGRSMSASETVTPRLRANDILLASDHPRQSIVHIRRGEGYAQYGGMPFVMTSTHHISYDRYRKRKNSSWPKHRPEETLIPELQMPRIHTQVPTASNPDDPPDPVLDAAEPENDSPSSETINALWRDHEQRKAKTEKRLARKKRKKPSPEAEEDTDE